ncbi:hypothetical protein OG417_33010 [Actinoallomurus sp. NBC_01490]|nr:hypothetical protein [Actinoallomurus sp. NBC_01490]
MDPLVGRVLDGRVLDGRHVVGSRVARDGMATVYAGHSSRTVRWRSR